MHLDSSVSTLPKVSLVLFLKEGYILLAMKKRGFGAGFWNGYGGKQEPQDPTILDTAIRETREESGATPLNLQKVAIIRFYFPHKPDQDQECHIYTSTEWEGEPAETSEMRPAWFSFSEIPYRHMWSDDIFWLPAVLDNQLIEGDITFGLVGEVLISTLATTDCLSR
jgi:8-oxo-dGTP pyrophosphatase MutT (NUDIX family)